MLIYICAADSASALVLELRRADAPGARDFVRVRFANGSAGAFETLHAFGHAGDIALTELLYRTRVSPRLSSFSGRAAR